MLLQNIFVKKIRNPLYAIEIDRDLVKYLKKKFGILIKLYSENALNFNFSEISISNNIPSLRIIGNLPYNISTPLLFHLNNFSRNIIDQHVMLQKEMAERILAKSGSKKFGKISIMLQYKYNIKKMIEIPPYAFKPSPKIYSTMIRMTPYHVNDIPKVNEKILRYIVNIAFSKRRKMLKNTLSILQKKINLDEINIDLQKRPEDISVKEYISIAQKISNFF